MSKTVTVTLDSPIEGHEGAIRQVKFREPRYRDIMGHGQPYSVHTGPNGDPIVIYDQDVITHYVEACCIEPKEASLLQQLGMKDTFAVRRAVLDFFLPPGGADAGSKTSPETSGSDADADPAKSAT